MNFKDIRRRLSQLEKDYRSHFIKKITFVMDNGSRVVARDDEADVMLYLQSVRRTDPASIARRDLLSHFVEVSPADGLLYLARALELTPRKKVEKNLTVSSPNTPPPPPEQL